MISADRHSYAIRLAAATEAALRTLGATAVMLRVPVPQSGAGTVGLGLAEAAWEESTLDPVIVRTLTDGSLEVTVGGDTMSEAVGDTADGLQKMLMPGARLDVNGTTMRILDVKAEYAAGVPYLYKLRIEE